MSDMSAFTSLLEVSVAASVTYLALERYRYRDSIKRYAEKILTLPYVPEDSEPDDEPIDRMADEGNNPVHAQMRKEDHRYYVFIADCMALGKNGEEAKVAMPSPPDGNARYVQSYYQWYATHADRRLVSFSAFASVAFLVLIAAIEVGAMGVGQSVRLMSMMGMFLFLGGLLALFLDRVPRVALRAVLVCGVVACSAAAAWAAPRTGLAATDSWLGLEVVAFLWIGWALSLPVAFVLYAIKMVGGLQGQLETAAHAYKNRYTEILREKKPQKEVKEDVGRFMQRFEQARTEDPSPQSPA